MPVNHWRRHSRHDTKIGPLMDTIKLSKKLSYVLRHKPQSIGLKLDKSGWANVNDILAKMGMTQTELDQVVADNNKQRFEFSEDKRRIRARQGHSVQVDLGYKPLSPPDILYHGTDKRLQDTLKKEGIKKMNRHHVHLSPDEQTAKIVGARHGPPLVILIDAKRMAADGCVFYKTENNVWLTDFIDPKYML